VDPATNIHPISSAKGHDVFCGYFEDFRCERQFDIINAAHVFAHNRDCLAFLKGLKALMHDDSILFVQTSQADMVLNGEFDTIYHEHINFFNAASMLALSKRAGLPMIDILKTQIHGTSYVFVFSKTRPVRSHLAEVLEEERAAGLQAEPVYDLWASRFVPATFENIGARGQRPARRTYRCVPRHGAPFHANDAAVRGLAFQVPRHR